MIKHYEHICFCPATYIHSIFQNKKFYFIFSKKMAIMYHIWFGLHVSVLVTALLFLLSLLSLFDVKLGISLANLSIILLYGFCLYSEISSVQQKTMIPKLLFKNYSFHILTITIFFQLIQSRPIQWYIAMGFASFYQILNYILTKYPNSQSKIIGIMRKIFAKLTNPPIAFQLLAMFEIMTVWQAGPRNSLVMSLIGTVVYAFWLLMFRYEVDQCHKLIWGHLKTQIQGLALKCPAIIQKILYPLSTSLEPLGQLAHKIYG